MLIDYLNEPEPIGSSRVRHQLGNFSLQLLVSKGGKRFLLTKWGDKSFYNKKVGEKVLNPGDKTY